MLNFFRKTVSLFLCTAILFTNSIVVFADRNSERQPLYIPLKNAFDSGGGEVRWDEETGFIIATYNDNIYKFKANQAEAYKNDEEYTMNYSVYEENGKAYISYYDAAFLFEGGSEGYEETIKSAVTTAYTFMAYYSIPGVTISFTDAENDFIWTQGLGYSDVENNIPVNEKSIFSLASISKTFTAISIMQLVEKGLIDLDAPIVDYLPGFSVKSHPVYGGNYEDITVRMLLSHTSAIPGDTFKAFYTTEGYNKEYMDHFIEDLTAQYMDGEAGKRITYANNGYMLLGILVAELTGDSGSYFDDFVDYTNKNIFDKAGMALSSFKYREEMEPFLARPYMSAESPRAEQLYVNAVPAGGLYSNAEDMALFMNFMLKSGAYKDVELLSPASIMQMAQVQNFDYTLSPQMKTGLGLYQTYVGTLTLTGHGGNIIYYNSDMQYNFENKLGVFVSSNSATSATAMANLSYYILNEAIHEKSGIRHTLSEESEVLDAEFIPANPEKYTGIYTTVGEVKINENGNLYIPMLGLELEPLANGSFNSALGRIWFDEVEGNTVIFFGEDRSAVLGEKIEVTKADKDFNQWVGTYYDSSARKVADNESIFPKIVLGVTEDGYAYIEIFINDGSNGSMYLEKIDENTYYVAGKGRNYSKVIEFNSDIFLTTANFFGVEFVKR